MFIFCVLRRSQNIYLNLIIKMLLYVKLTRLSFEGEFSESLNGIWSLKIKIKFESILKLN